MYREERQGGNNEDNGKCHYPKRQRIGSEFVESEGGWLNNPGFHGLSEQLYEYTSSAANNGSGFEGLGDNTYFWNWTCGTKKLIYYLSYLLQT